MANKTKLERMSYAELQMNENITKAELIKMIKTSEKKLDRQFKQIETAGYELTDFQRTYINRRNKRLPLEQMDNIADLKIEASNIKRQLEVKSSSLGGVRKISENRLTSMFGDVKKDSGENAKLVKRRKNEKGDIYRIGEIRITNKELSEFWKAVKEVDEELNFLKIKGGSEDGIYEVRQLFFGDKKITNKVDLINELKDKKEDETKEEDKIKEEEREVFSNVQKEGRVWKS